MRYGYMKIGDSGSQLYIGSAGNVIVGHHTGSGDFNVMKGGVATEVNFYTFSATTSHASILNLGHSLNNTINSYTETTNGSVLALVRFRGVNSSSALNYGARVQVTQSGSAGASYIPSDMKIETYSASAVNTNQLVLNSDGSVQIDNGFATFGSGNLELVSSDEDKPGLLIHNTKSDDAGSAGIFLRKSRNSLACQDDDSLGVISFQGYNSSNILKTFGDIYWLATDVTSGTEDARMAMRCVQGTSLGVFLSCDNSNITINASGLDRDFLVRDANNNVVLRVDAAATYGNVVINGASISPHYDLLLAGDGVLALKETSTPTANTNYGKVYCKDDNKLYFQDGAGSEHEIAYA